MPASTVDQVRRRCEQRHPGWTWGTMLSYAEPYARAAFDAEVQAVATAPQGCRNHTLFVAACNLLELVNGVALPGNVVEEALWTAAIRNGLPAREVEQTLLSAARKVAGKARTAPTPEGRR